MCDLRSQDVVSFARSFALTCGGGGGTDWRAESADPIVIDAAPARETSFRNWRRLGM